MTYEKHYYEFENKNSSNQNRSTLPSSLKKQFILKTEFLFSRVYTTATRVESRFSLQNSISLLKSKNERKEKKRNLYESWNEHLRTTKENTLYSSRRMDLLIISLSSAGIYIILNTFKEVKKNSFEIENDLILKIGGLFFLFAIMLNFLSQQTAYYANKFEEEFINLKLEEIKGEKINQCESKKIDKKVSLFDKSTGILNFMSIILMFIGLILLTFFSFYL